MVVLLALQIVLGFERMQELNVTLVVCKLLFLHVSKTEGAHSILVYYDEIEVVLEDSALNL